MAKFCQNCGTKLEDDAMFCASCGTQVASEEAPQYKQQETQPRQYNAPQVHVPEQFAARNAERAKRQSAPKKKGHGGTAALISILVIAVGVVAFFGFRDGGWFRGDKNVKDETASHTEYDAGSLQSLLDYARQLEEAGNYEAASAVYALIPEGYGAELIDEAHKNIPMIQYSDEIDEYTGLFGAKGGD